jgi:hypothetical protein
MSRRPFGVSKIDGVRAGKILDGIDVFDAARYAGRVEGAARVLCEAVASRNGTAEDAEPAGVHLRTAGRSR